MNDGEFASITNSNNCISRGYEKNSPDMSKKLLECLHYQAPNYYIGIPCEGCNKFQHDEILKMCPNNKSSFLNAHTLINDNYNTTLDILSKSLVNQNIVIILNSEMVKNISMLEKYNITPNKVISVSPKYAFSNDYENIKDEVKNIANNSVVLCLCGPLGRILCYEWYKYNPTLTCLELGSFFDPILNNKSYLYHEGTLPYCNVCSKYSDKETEIMQYAKDNINKECIYFLKNEDNINYYSNNINKIIKNYENIIHNGDHGYIADKDKYLKELEKFTYKNIVDKQSLSFSKNYNTIIKYEKKLKLENKEEREIVAKYKSKNKSELYHLCGHLYTNRNLHELKLVSQFYLSLFNYEIDYDYLKVQFYYGFANFDNPTIAIEMFEDLYNNIKFENEHFFVKCNLDILYPKIKDPIPPFIHLIYYKEREFEKYHLKCIKNMRHFFPNYKIFLYNDDEPVNNIYWNEVKEINNLEIIKRDRPKEFDGFPVKYVQYAADITRLEILYEYGGIYLDFDMLILKNFECLFENHSLIISEENSNKSNNLINSILIAKPKNEFLKIWLESFKVGLRVDKWAFHINTFNRKILDENKHFELKYGIKILNSKYFLSFIWEDTNKFLNIKENITEEMYGVHLFDTIHHNNLKNNSYFD